MKKLLYISFLSASLVLLGGCVDSEEDLKEELLAGVDSSDGIDPGTADFSKYVAIGSSLTAGLSDGALYPQGQANSYPVILATQLSLAGGGEFGYPDISSGNGFGGLNADNSIRGKSFIDIASALTNPANAIQFTTGTVLNSS